ncbi:hypothetical protein BU15DRAFT_58848 [Melanogaster broomeanus]|nr:hypothetical protein BU15DRAFT_58848 [Melanogaster broomeanus]
MSGIDWTHCKMQELDSDVKDNDDVALAKAKERRWCKVEKKHQEEEQRRREEEAKHRREVEEAEAECKRREAEQKEHEEMPRKATEANKKRQREEVEARSSVACGSGMCCMRCTRAGVPCEFTNNGNKRQTTCDRCAAVREKCEWPEMYAPRARKGKGKEVPTSPRQGEKKKCVQKAKVQEVNEVEIIGESSLGPDQAGFHWTGSRLQAQRESTQQRSRASTEGVDAGVKEGQEGPGEICGRGRHLWHAGGVCWRVDREEVDEGEIDEELARLQEDMAENPMSPNK